MVVHQLPLNPSEIPIQKIEFLSKNGVEVHVKRLDLIHPYISGNKYFKLKYNIQAMQEQGKTSMLTFGGAYSNHIRAVAYAGFLYQFKTIGIIRGDELAGKTLNPNLQFAKDCGMNFVFVNRSEYRLKNDSNYLKTIQQNHPNTYVVPEGGTNHFAIKGCQEILDANTKDFTHIACAIGTAGTFAGLLKASNNNQTLLGFPVLKNAFWAEDIIKNYTSNDNFRLFFDAHHGGYAKVTKKLLTFEKSFATETKINLESIYTSKMFFALNTLINNQYFKPNSKVLCIHTGGIFESNSNTHETK